MKKALHSLTLIAMTAAIASLSACGGGDNDDAETTAAAPTSSSTTTASNGSGSTGTTTTTTTPKPAPAPAPKPAPAPAPTPAPAPAPAPSSSAVNGKSLYQASCASCHGSNPAKNTSKILKGTSASTTLKAIAENKGGMGYLKGSIGSKEASDIAAYLAHPNI